MIPHATKLESYAYTRGCITDDDYYAAAGFGEQPLRYWLDSGEVNRRLAIRNARNAQLGIGVDGRHHNIDFETELATAG